MFSHGEQIVKEYLAEVHEEKIFELSHNEKTDDRGMEKRQKSRVQGE